MVQWLTVCKAVGMIELEATFGVYNREANSSVNRGEEASKLKNCFKCWASSTSLISASRNLVRQAEA